MFSYYLKKVGTGNIFRHKDGFFTKCGKDIDKIRGEPKPSKKITTPPQAYLSNDDHLQASSTFFPLYNNFIDCDSLLQPIVSPILNERKRKTPEPTTPVIPPPCIAPLHLPPMNVVDDRVERELMQQRQLTEALRQRVEALERESLQQRLDSNLLFNLLLRSQEIRSRQDQIIKRSLVFIKQLYLSTNRFSPNDEVDKVGEMLNNISIEYDPESFDRVLNDLS